MKVLHLFDPDRSTGKFFMVLILLFREKMALAKGGGFDKIIGTVGWIAESVLQGSIRMPDKEAYIFRGYREQLDFIASQLEEKAGWPVKIRNIFNTPSISELLAAMHSIEDAGTLNLYIDQDLPLLAQRRRKLWATYWPRDGREYAKIMRQYRSSNSRVGLALADENVIVSRGFFQSGYAHLQSYLNEHEGFSMTTNVLGADSYPTLLLRSVLQSQLR